MAVHPRPCIYFVQGTPWARFTPYDFTVWYNDWRSHCVVKNRVLDGDRGHGHGVSFKDTQGLRKDESTERGCSR